MFFKFIFNCYKKIPPIPKNTEENLFNNNYFLSTLTPVSTTAPSKDSPFKVFAAASTPSSFALACAPSFKVTQR